MCYDRRGYDGGVASANAREIVDDACLVVSESHQSRKVIDVVCALEASAIYDDYHRHRCWVICFYVAAANEIQTERKFRDVVDVLEASETGKAAHGRMMASDGGVGGCHLPGHVHPARSCRSLACYLCRLVVEVIVSLGMAGVDYRTNGLFLCRDLLCHRDCAGPALGHAIGPILAPARVRRLRAVWLPRGLCPLQSAPMSAVVLPYILSCC